MSTTLSMNNCGGNVGWSLDSVLAWGNANNSSSFNSYQNFTQGSGAGQVSKLYVAQGTISPSGTLSLDLAGSLVDMFGNALVFTAVKVLFVQNTNDTTATGIIIGGDTNAFGATAPKLFNAKTETVRIANPGSFIAVNGSAAGHTVTAGTGDILLLTNEDSVNTATYKLVVAGI